MSAKRPPRCRICGRDLTTAPFRKDGRCGGFSDCYRLGHARLLAQIGQWKDRVRTAEAERNAAVKALRAAGGLP